MNYAARTWEPSPVPSSTDSASIEPLRTVGHRIGPLAHDCPQIVLCKRAERLDICTRELHENEILGRETGIQNTYVNVIVKRSAQLHVTENLVLMLQRVSILFPMHERKINYTYEVHHDALTLRRFQEICPILSKSTVSY